MDRSRRSDDDISRLNGISADSQQIIQISLGTVYDLVKQMAVLDNVIRGATDILMGVHEWRFHLHFLIQVIHATAEQNPADFIFRQTGIDQFQNVLFFHSAYTSHFKATISHSCLIINNFR